MFHQQIENIKASIKTGVINRDFYFSLISLIENQMIENKIFGVWHPLGFIVITLQDWTEEERLRIHIWPESKREFNQGVNWIHNHAYDIISLVLIGNITNQKFQLVNQGINSALPTFSVEYNGNNSDLKMLNYRSDIESISQEIISNGNIYSIKKWDFHLSETNINEMTATIVLNTNRDKESPIIIGGSKQNDTSIKFARDEYNDDILYAMLNKVLKKLKQNSLNH